MQASRAGTTLKAGTIAGYVSAIKVFRAREAGVDVTPSSAALLLPLALKRMRHEDEPSGERRLSRGFRAAHFATLVAKGYDRWSPRGVVEWAAALLAHNILLGGGGD
eukprot:5446363-Pleurochrysis_carterae.AAC.2